MMLLFNVLQNDFRSPDSQCRISGFPWCKRLMTATAKSFYLTHLQAHCDFIFFVKSDRALLYMFRKKTNQSIIIGGEVAFKKTSDVTEKETNA